MSSVNKVILLGRVGQAPEIRATKDGKKIASLSIATSEGWRDKETGERKEKTEWHRVVCFNESLSKVIEAYVGKGSQIYIEGSLQTRKYTDKEGVEKYATEVVLQAFNSALVLLGGKKDGGEAPARNSYAEAKGKPTISQQAVAAQAPLDRELDDEVPF